MKKIVRKIIAAAMATSIMATAAISASANTWQVRHVNGTGIPSSVQIQLDEFDLYQTSGKYLMGVYEQCTSYTSQSSEYGQYAYVRYWGWGVDYSGAVVGGHSFGAHIHDRTSSESYISITNPINGSDGAVALRMKYELHNTFSGTALGCNISGVVNKREV